MSDYFFLSQTAIGRVNAMFRLPASGKEQDWEVELADPERRQEFFDALTLDALAHDPETEAAVAALFIASADDAIGAGQFSKGEDEAAREYFQRKPELRDKMSRLWFQRSEPIHAKQIGAWLK